MKYSISLNFKYLSIKMNWEKLNFEPIGNSALGKALLAKLYLKVKAYTNLLSVYNLLCL